MSPTLPALVRRVVGGGLALLVLAIPAVSRGQTAAATQKGKAKRLLDEGAGLYDAGDITGALGRFNAAYDAYPSPKILLNIGTTLKRIGRLAEAAQAYDRFLSEAAAQTDIGDDKVQAARSAIAELLPRVGRLRLDVAPPDATVSVDDRSVGLASKLRVLYLAPGERRISATAPGYLVATATTVAAAGREERMSLALAALGKPAPVADAPPRKRFFTWMAAGTAVACGGAGSVFGLQARARFQDLKAASASTASDAASRWDAAKERLDRASLTANVLFAAAGVAALTATILFFTEGRTVDEPGRDTAWLIGPTADGRGIAAQGRF